MTTHTPLALLEAMDLSHAEVRHPGSGRLIAYDKEAVHDAARRIVQSIVKAGGVAPQGPMTLANGFIDRREVGWSHPDLDAAELSEPV